MQVFVAEKPSLRCPWLYRGFVKYFLVFEGIDDNFCMIYVEEAKALFL